MKPATIGGLGLLAGVAVVESALIPGLLLGAAVVVLPKFLMRGQQTGRGRSQARAMAIRLGKPPYTAKVPPAVAAAGALSAPFEVKQAVFKTITFRMVATSFDFAANMVVIGNVTTAASLSAFGLVGAPVFYFCHELFWHRVAPAGRKVNVGTLLRRNKTRPLGEGRGLTINRTLAKTITYEIVTTTVDFSANYVATRDVVAAAGLTVFAAVISPFIYYGHEKLWDHFGPADPANQRQRASLLPINKIALSSSSNGV
jgi:uncharacterized membrane protein